jgi:hypothetical protein
MNGRSRAHLGGLRWHRADRDGLWLEETDGRNLDAKLASRLRRRHSSRSLLRLRRTSSASSPRCRPCQQASGDGETSERRGDVDGGELGLATDDEFSNVESAGRRLVLGSGGSTFFSARWEARAASSELAYGEVESMSLQCLAAAL